MGREIEELEVTSEDHARAILRRSQERREQDRDRKRAYRARKKEEELAALRMLGHNEGCTPKGCHPECLVLRFGSGPDR